MKAFFENLDSKTKKLIKIGIIFFVIFILIIVGIQIYHLIAGTMIPYNQLEQKIETSAINYFAKDDRLPKNEGESKTVDTSTLISEKYMRTMDKYTKDTGCNGTTTVTNNGGNYLYNTNIKCNDYKTTTIANKIMSTLVESGDGLYLDNNVYYYRGEYVNNYINIGGTDYRILEIDGSGNLKLINLSNLKENFGTSWDDRFNEEMGIYGIGINDFEKSRIKERLLSDYSSFSTDLKKYVLNYEWCIGKRPLADNTISTTNECSLTTKMFVGLMIPSEVARVSLDSNCNSIISSSCVNYSYISNDMGSYALWSLTGVADNSFNIFTLSNGSAITSTYAINLNRAADVFYINGNNVYLSGDGSLKNPYKIK